MGKFDFCFVDLFVLFMIYFSSVDLLNSSNESDSPKIERKNRRVLQSSSSETEMVSDSPDETDDDL